MNLRNIRKATIFLTMIVVAMLVVGFAGCKSDESVEDGIVDSGLEKPGIAPYEMSEEQELVMESLGMDTEAGLIAFKAPDDAVELRCHLYSFDGKKELEGTAMLGVEKKSDSFEGICAVLLNQDGSIEVTINYQGISGAMRNSGKLKESLENATVSSYVMNESGDGFVEAELGKKVPVALIQSSAAGHISVYALEEFDLDKGGFPEGFKKPDELQIIALEFVGEKQR